MKTIQYEAMFLLENNAATADFDGTAGQVDQILEKHGLTILQKEKWDERKLAYEIKGQRRATYYLVYCEGPTTAMDPIDEDLGLNEVVLRYLFIRLEEPVEVHIEKRATEREALAEDSRRNSLSGWGDRRKRKDRPRDDQPAGDAKPAAAAKPEAGAAQPEAAKQEATKPEAATPEAAKPEAAEPEGDEAKSAVAVAEKPAASEEKKAEGDASPAPESKE